MEAKRDREREELFLKRHGTSLVPLPPPESPKRPIMGLRGAGRDRRRTGTKKSTWDTSSLTNNVCIASMHYFISLHYTLMLWGMWQFTIEITPPQMLFPEVIFDLCKHDCIPNFKKKICITSKYLNYHLLVNPMVTHGSLRAATYISFNLSTIWVPFLVDETAFGARERAV